MFNVNMRSLLEAGAHFGHQKYRWNPKMKKYIFAERNNLHIIDLQETVRSLKIAYDYVRDEVAKGKKVLLVGTKRQAQKSIMEEATRCGAFYVNNRWLGGLLTNFETVRQSIKKMRNIENMKLSEEWNKLTKKEIAILEKEYLKLERSFLGIKEMNSLPDLVFTIDPEEEKIAILECRKLGIPVVSVVDTNCNPDMIDVVIPGNDDAIRSIKLFASVISEAIIEGSDIYKKTFSDIEASENNSNENFEEKVSSNIDLESIETDDKIGKEVIK